MESVRMPSGAPAKKNLGEMLVEANLITAEQLKYALGPGRENGKGIGDILVNQGLVNPKDLAMVLSLQLRVPFFDLKRHKVQPEALRLIPEAMARKYNIIPLDTNDGALVVAMADPEDIPCIEDLAAQAKMRIEPVIGVADEIHEAIDLSYKAIGETEKESSQVPAPAPQEENIGMSSVAAPEESLGEMLVEAHLITAEQMEDALRLGRENGKRIGDILVSQGLITPKDLAMVLSIQLRMPLFDLKRHRVQPEALGLIPEAMARKYNIMPLEFNDGALVVAMADPENIRCIEDLAAQSKMRIEPVIGVADEIREAIDLSYKATGEIEKEIGQVPGSARQQEVEAAEDRISAEALAQTPIVRAVDLLIGQAVKDRASDIHIEPQENRLRIRYRIDGILHDMMSLPLNVHAALVSRVKILAGMNIAEKKRPQDGQFSFKLGDRDVDLRIGSSDTGYGEMLVLRVLDKSLSLYTLHELGFLADSLQRYQQMLKSSFGMILVSGPTGSGKTTTLYASINELDRNEHNIMTIEDPIEYRFLDINQIHVNARAGVTFASGLRGIMRLDPDIVMVGEIRDSETAKIACQAALTGQLVLSSVHANDAVGVLFRLLDLGVEPFIISSTLVGVVAQRMLRRICPYCRTISQAPIEEQVAYEEEMQAEQAYFYRGTGCSLCANTGYLGRTGVFEIMVMTEEIRRMLLTGAAASDIRAQATKEGMVPMRGDGMLKVKEGITTPHEVLRNVFSIS